MEPEDPMGLDNHPDDPRSLVFLEPDDQRSSGFMPCPDDVLGLPQGHTEEFSDAFVECGDPIRMRAGDIGVDGVDGVMPSSTVDDGVGIGGVIGVDDGVGISGVDADGSGVQHADVIETVSEVGEPFAAETTSPESLVGAHVLLGTKSVRQGEDVEVVNTDDDDVEADDDDVEADEDDVKADEDDVKADDDDDSGEEEIDD
ncbi:hypothetical protein AALP_AA2G055700 [Arabis alpina]|uniref:Uncharacterized protein n=1 Tax=Arabis alpina TaxID=50452 RepID=A0A087HFI4_ARAAL|nr:hypothetical protein AALP_AA2G055700 [Arabis alpina]